MANYNQLDGLTSFITEMSKMFAPPSSQDALLSAKARRERQDANFDMERRAAYLNPETTREVLDRYNEVNSGDFGTTGARYTMEDETNRYNIDTQAKTSMRNQDVVSGVQRDYNDKLARLSGVELAYGPDGTNAIPKVALEGIVDGFEGVERTTPVAPQPPMSLDQLRAQVSQERMAEGLMTQEDFLASGAKEGGDTSAEQSIARVADSILMDNPDMPPAAARQIAVNIKDGRWKVDQHPTSGKMIIVDIATGQNVPPEAFATATPDSPIIPVAGEVGAGNVSVQDLKPVQESRSTMPTGIDYTSAMGTGGFVSNMMNTTSELLGGGLISPQNEQATQALRNLNNQTMIDLAGAVAGRPSNYLLQKFEELNAKPNSPFQGEGRIAERMVLTRNMIAEGIKENEMVLANPDIYDPAEIATAQRNISRLSRLVDDHDVVLESLGRPQEGSRVTPTKKEADVNKPVEGHIEDGYRFLGGDPTDMNSWEQVE